MIAAVLLVLATVGPGAVDAPLPPQRMPSLAACERALKAWIAGEADQIDQRSERPSTRRYGACLTIPVDGRDA